MTGFKHGSLSNGYRVEVTLGKDLKEVKQDP